jgi:hypothetical protein
MQELAGLIDNRDADALQVFAELRDLLAPLGIEDQLRKLESALHRFDFSQAREALEDAMSAMAPSGADKHDSR